MKKVLLMLLLCVSAHAYAAAEDTDGWGYIKERTEVLDKKKGMIVLRMGKYYRDEDAFVHLIMAVACNQRQAVALGGTIQRNGMPDEQLSPMYEFKDIDVNSPLDTYAQIECKRFGFKYKIKGNV